MDLRKRLLKQNSGEIAFGYKKLEYIRSVPYTYIDTGVLITTDLEMEFEFSIETVIAGQYIMGKYTPGGGTFFLYTSAPKCYWQTAYGFSYVNASKIAEPGNHLFRYSIENNTAHIYYGDELIASKEIEELSTETIKICGYNGANIIPCNTYSFKMKRAGEIIKNFLPCMRVADGKVGMYDTVTNGFYTSATSYDFLPST